MMLANTVALAASGRGAAPSSRRVRPHASLPRRTVPAARPPLRSARVLGESAHSEARRVGLSIRSSTACAASADATRSSGSAPELDVEALVRFFAATALELGLMCLFMLGVQTIILPNVSKDVGTWLVFVMYLYLSVKSRIFNVLGAKRPSVKDEDRAKQENRRPSWMPPPVVFPVVWITIAFLRAQSSTMVWEWLGRDLLALPLVAFLLHLSIGDTWNHVTNVKKQLGVSFAGTAFVWGSVVTVTSLYYRALPDAGLILAPSVVWLTIASYLVYCIWRLNGPEKHPLYPPKV